MIKKSIFIVCFLTAGVAVSLQAAKPNFVFIIADDCTYRDIGCYGGQAYTPNIDRLATQGMRFTRCFQAAPMCSPTRHNIYTGQYPVKTGAYPNHTHLNPGIKTVAQLMKPLGYRVAQAGKKHVGPASAFTWENITTGPNPDFKKVETFLADCSKNQDPFCLLLCSNEPHTPWNKGDPSRYPPANIKLPPYYIDTPQIREGLSRYLAEITYFDDQVGQALALLDKYQLAENTMFIMVSEQGNSLPFAKWTCYDSGIQSAFIVRWPGHVKPNTVNPAMIEYVDILPTFIEAAGGEPGPELDGKSLLDVFAGKQTHKKFIFSEQTSRGINNGPECYGIRCVRSEQYKYILNFTPQIEFQNACTQSREFLSWIDKAKAGDEKAALLVDRYCHRPRIELYDIIKDPFEMHNLAGQPNLQNVENELRAQLNDWMANCSDQGQKTEMQALDHMGKARKITTKTPKAKS